MSLRIPVRSVPLQCPASVVVSVAGLFDDCLKDQAEHHSHVVTNAELQYHATVALHAKKVD